MGPTLCHLHAICEAHSIAPSIDLFALHLNNKLPHYCSFTPDPSCTHVDMFTLTWSQEVSYIFPPFNLLHRCLHKLHHEQATALLIFPMSPNQPWFPLMLHLLVHTPSQLPLHPPLQLPWNPNRQHPNQDNLKLFCCALWACLQEEGFSQVVQDNLATNLQLSSQKGYSAHIRKWLLFCSHQQVDPMQPSENDQAEFFTTTHNLANLKNARSAIAWTLATTHVPFIQMRNISKLIGGHLHCNTQNCLAICCR